MRPLTLSPNLQRTPYAVAHFNQSNRLLYRWIPLILGVALFFGVTISTSAQAEGGIAPISIDPLGEFGNGNSQAPFLSEDGRFVFFESQATNLTENSQAGFFLHDQLTGDTRPILMTPPGISEAAIQNASLSADGRFITFSALKGNTTQIYRHDLLSQETKITSASEDGVAVMDASYFPSISNDGRFIGFLSAADNLTQRDKNPSWDAFIHDHVTGHNYLATGGLANGINIAPKQPPILSDDGRTLIFTAENIAAIFLYNRVLDSTSSIELPATLSNDDLLALDASGSAKTIAFALCLNGRLNIFTQEVAADAPQLVFEGNDCQNGQISIALSTNGKVLGIRQPKAITRVDIESGEKTLIDQTLSAGTIDISVDGKTLAYTVEIDGVDQVFVWDENAEAPIAYVLAGRVTDETGLPLALVTITNADGRQTRSDEGGYFWINGISQKSAKITPFKEGYRFEPEKIPLDLQSDVSEIQIKSAHEKALQEAQLDLGMPYSQNRGTSGPFHGYRAGYCTDLILDAYTWGVDFNIQFALEQDYRAQPWHFYRWRDARNAHDMWRYFSYSGQMQPHETPYLPGDIIFFDWDQDGEIDHVSIMSEVTDNYRPDMMYDATGIINSNPKGLAAELPWEPFHEETVRGKARWNGKYEPVIPEMPTGEGLQLALGSSGATLKLLDRNGNEVSNDESNIPGGRSDNWVWEQSIHLETAFGAGSQFLVVIANPAEKEIAYQFIAQFTADGLVTGREEIKDHLGAGEIRSYFLTLKRNSADDVILELGQSRRIIGKFRK